MKISVLGNIIETKDIYLISKIKEEKSSLRFLGYSFIIKFFNDKDLKIFIEDGRKLEVINKLRNEVIKYWEENKTEIPLLEFDDLEEKYKLNKY